MRLRQLQRLLRHLERNVGRYAASAGPSVPLVLRLTFDLRAGGAKLRGWQLSTQEDDDPPACKVLSRAPGAGAAVPAETYEKPV